MDKRIVYIAGSILILLAPAFLLSCDGKPSENEAAAQDAAFDRAVHSASPGSTSDAPDSPEPQEASHLPAAVKQRMLHLEIFLMGLCPYGPPLVSTLLDITEERPDLFIMEVLFIGEPGEDGIPICPGGEEELAENLLQVAMLNTFPGIYAEYVRCLAEGRGGGGCLSAAADRKSLETIEAFRDSPQAMEILLAQSELSVEVGVGYSPTLYIDAEEYRGSHSPDRVLSWLSLITDDKALKESYPPPAAFPIHPVIPSESAAFDESGIVNALDRLFPAASVLPWRWPETGNDLPRGGMSSLADAVAAAEIRVLPVIFFGRGVEKAYSFNDISARLTPVGEFLVDFMEDASTRVFVDRKRTEDSLTVFGAGLSPRFFGCLALLDSLGDSGSAVRDYGVAYITSEYKGTVYSKGGAPELEEDRRQIAIKSFYPEKYASYLRIRGNSLGTSYWEEPLEAAGLDPNEIKRLSKTDEVSRLLAADRGECLELGIYGDLALVVENKKVVYSPSPERVVRLIRSMSGEALPPEPSDVEEERCPNRKD